MCHVHPLQLIHWGATLSQKTSMRSRHLHGQCSLYHLGYTPWGVYLFKLEHTTLNWTVPLCSTPLYHFTWKVIEQDCSWHLQTIRQCFAVPTMQWLLQRKLSPTTVCITKVFCGTKHPSLLLFWHQCLLLRTLVVGQTALAGILSRIGSWEEFNISRRWCQKCQYWD